MTLAEAKTAKLNQLLRIVAIFGLAAMSCNAIANPAEAKTKTYPCDDQLHPPFPQVAPDEFILISPENNQQCGITIANLELRDSPATVVLVVKQDPDNNDYFALGIPQLDGLIRVTNYFHPTPEESINLEFSSKKADFLITTNVTLLSNNDYYIKTTKANYPDPQTPRPIPTIPASPIDTAILSLN